MFSTTRFQRRARQDISQVTRALDHQPPARVVVIGVILGLGIGIPGLFYLRSPAWMVLWGMLLGII